MCAPAWDQLADRVWSVSPFILWDVDGTLLRTPGVGIAALHRAIQRVTGMLPSEALPYAGMLDHRIALDHLNALGLDGQAHLQAVLAASEQELAAARADITAQGFLLPGVAELLARLSGIDGVLQTVLTGNLRANAVLKVTEFGLDQWLDLDVGAYADDGPERSELVSVALRRASELRDRQFDLSDIWVIGDTGHDLACARANGVQCLLVGTGWEPLPVSARKEADAFLPDLSDTDAVLGVLRTAIDHDTIIRVDEGRSRVPDSTDPECDPG